MMWLLVVSTAVIGRAWALCPPQNDVLLRAARGEAVERTPVWLFRQAGRHMPEYRKFKEDSGQGFLEILDDPVSVAEVTMQPLRRYDVDAGILFSDILVLAQAMGVKVEMPGGKGIVVPEPVADAKRAEYVAAIAGHDPEWLISKYLKHVTRAVEEIRAAQLKEDRDVTLLGFSAAPWTLLYYVLGSNSRDDGPARRFVKRESDALVDSLLDSFESLILAYSYAQVEAGAHAVQIFDAMAGGIDPKLYDDMILPRLTRLADRFKTKYPDVPLLCFSRGVANPLETNELLANHYDVVTLETRADRRRHRGDIASCLQGNLDPKLLVNANDNSKDKLLKETANLVSDLGSGPWIANLGEGLAGTEDPDLVAAFVDAVHAPGATAAADADETASPDDTRPLVVN